MHRFQKYITNTYLSAIKFNKFIDYTIIYLVLKMLHKYRLPKMKNMIVI